MRTFLFFLQITLEVLQFWMGMQLVFGNVFVGDGYVRVSCLVLGHREAYGTDCISDASVLQTVELVMHGKS